MNQGPNGDFFERRAADDAANERSGRRETLVLISLLAIGGVLGYGIGVVYHWPQPLGAAVLGIAAGLGVASVLPR